MNEIFYITLFLMKNNIKECRLKRGITVKEMAKMLNVSRNTYTNYENGSYEASYETLKRISEILNTSLDVLLDNGPFLLNQKSVSDLIAAIENVTKDFK